MKKSISWLKMNSDHYEACLSEFKRVKTILQKMGYEVLVLETDSLQGILYEDSFQVLTMSNQN